jgi:hypothetical protein
LKGTVSNDTIWVGYYFYKEPKSFPDTSLLTLTTYTGSSITKDYYIFPEYDATKGIKEIRKDSIGIMMKQRK